MPQQVPLPCLCACSPLASLPLGAPQVVGPNCENLYRNTFTYHTVTPCANSKEVPLQECTAFLTARAADHHKVLVFCMTGSSR